VNEYVDRHKPWEWPSKPGMDAALHDVCSVCIEAFRVLTVYLKPVLPALAAQVEVFLRIDPLAWADAQRALGAHTIGEYKHLMQRVDPKQLDALFEPPAADPGCARCCPAAKPWPPRSASTTSRGSTCGWPASWRQSGCRAAPSCCA
jgi:hypothetical protein